MLTYILGFSKDADLVDSCRFYLTTPFLMDVLSLNNPPESGVQYLCSSEARIAIGDRCGKYLDPTLDWFVEVN